MTTEVNGKVVLTKGDFLDAIGLVRVPASARHTNTGASQIYVEGRTLDFKIRRVEANARAGVELHITVTPVIRDPM